MYYGLSYFSSLSWSYGVVMHRVIFFPPGVFGKNVLYCLIFSNLWPLIFLLKLIPWNKKVNESGKTIYISHMWTHNFWKTIFCDYLQWWGRSYIQPHLVSMWGHGYNGEVIVRISGPLVDLYQFRIVKNLYLNFTSILSIVLKF